MYMYLTDVTTCTYMIVLLHGVHVGAWLMLLLWCTVLSRIRVRLKRLVNVLSLLNKKVAEALISVLFSYNDASFVVTVHVMITLTSSTCSRYDSTAAVVHQATCCSSTRARSAATSRTSRCCRTSTPACSSPSTSHPTIGSETWSSCTCLICCLVRQRLYVSSPSFAHFLRPVLVSLFRHKIFTRKQFKN